MQSIETAHHQNPLKKVVEIVPSKELSLHTP